MPSTQQTSPEPLACFAPALREQQRRSMKLTSRAEAQVALLRSCKNAEGIFMFLDR